MPSRRPRHRHIATGVWPDMKEHGLERDEWPEIFKLVKGADILVLCTAIWLGRNRRFAREL